jgi:hypothetical protein
VRYEKNNFRFMGQVLHFDQLWKDVDSKIFAKQRLQIVLLMTIVAQV